MAAGMPVFSILTGSSLSEGVTAAFLTQPVIAKAAVIIMNKIEANPFSFNYFLLFLRM